MDAQQAKRIADAIVKDVFGKESPIDLAAMQEKLTVGIPLPTVVPCSVTGEMVHVYDPQPEHKVISEAAYMDQAKIDDWMKPKRALGSIEDVLAAWEEVNYMSSNKAVESQDVEASDSVTASHGIYMSTLIGSSKNVILSHNNFFSNYLLACRGNSSCNFGIRIFDSIYCSSSYEVRWSNKISRSMFINDSLDLYECMFCYGIRSRKYCIANMQFEKDEYMKIKAMVIDWIFASWKQ